MILNVSGRCDIIAFYSEWFMNRYKEGFLDVRNPLYYKNVSRIYFKDVDLIVFCTKNPLPIIDKLSYIKKPILFHITITPYKNEIEKTIPKGLIIEGIKKVSKIIGIDNVYVRYDPIFISDKYNIEYHIKSFDNLCNILKGYTKRIIISFMDEYKNTKKNQKYLNYKNMSDIDYEIIGKSFYKSASKNGISLQTCSEQRNLTEYGFIKDDCLSKSLAYKLTLKKYPKWYSRNNKYCNCVKMIDIGVYNCCPHLCKYCYANFKEEVVNSNYLNHDKNSSLLIGHLNKDDNIRILK